MLRIYYGKDIKSVRDAAQASVRSYEADGYTIVRLEADQFIVGAVKNAIESVSLFGDSTAFLFDTPSGNPDFWSEIIECCEALNEVAIPFIVIEGQMNAAQKRSFGKTTEMQEYVAPAVDKFNTFLLADALATRNKKTLWVGLQAAYRDGQELAAIIGILWWQLKMIRLAQNTTSAEEAGVKSFPYQKAKKASFSSTELAELQFSLLQLYHQSRVGGREGQNALEAWVLRI